MLQIQKRPAAIRAFQARVNRSIMPGGTNMNTLDFSNKTPQSQIINQLGDNSLAANPEHSYLQNHGVKPYALRQIGCDLLAEIYSKLPGTNHKHYTDLLPENLLRINQEGSQTYVKPFKNGSFFAIGNNNKVNPVYLCISPADCLMLHEVSGSCCVASLKPENLVPVAQTLTKQLQGTPLIIVSDLTDAGSKYAELAALSTGADILIPPRVIPCWVNSFTGFRLWVNSLGVVA